MSCFSSKVYPFAWSTYSGEADIVCGHNSIQTAGVYIYMQCITLTKTVNNWIHTLRNQYQLSKLNSFIFLAPYPVILLQTYIRYVALARKMTVKSQVALSMPTPTPIFFLKKIKAHFKSVFFSLSKFSLRPPCHLKLAPIWNINLRPKWRRISEWPMR